MKVFTLVEIGRVKKNDGSVYYDLLCDDKNFLINVLYEKAFLTAFNNMQEDDIYIEKDSILTYSDMKQSVSRL